MFSDSQDLAHKAIVSERFAWVMCWVCALSTLIRPILSPQGAWFTLLGFASTLLAYIVYRMILSRRFDSQAPVMVLGVAAIALLPVLAVSGGVHSQFTPLVGLFPFLGWLLDGRRLSIQTAVFWSVCVLLGLALLPAVTDFANHEVPRHQLPVPRAAWLLITLGLSAYFACQFDRSFSLLQDQLRRQASEDPLTGLANRRTLNERLPQALRRAQRRRDWLSLLVIDADNFKQLNDTQGHAAGDACLVRLSEVLSRQTREGQDLVARFGGEEFVVLLESTDNDEAAAAAEHIRAAVAQAFVETEGAPDFGLTVTIGVATAYGGDLEHGVEQLLQAADAAMYQGKTNGRNRVELSSDPLARFSPA